MKLHPPHTPLSSDITSRGAALPQHTHGTLVSPMNWGSLVHSMFFWGVFLTAQYGIAFWANVTSVTVIDPHLFHPECKVFDFKCGSFCSVNSLWSQAEHLTDVKHLVSEVQWSNLESHYRPSTGGGHRGNYPAGVFLPISYPIKKLSFQYRHTRIFPVLENSFIYLSTNASWHWWESNTL